MAAQCKGVQPMKIIYTRDEYHAPKDTIVTRIHASQIGVVGAVKKFYTCLLYLAVPYKRPKTKGDVWNLQTPYTQPYKC
jgi:hypothetical protein